ncbi:hypothetical protein IWZ03DRAFT_425996 [Phyllosticta citriasiana]|uniref:Uncharacterized protein n=1 Tax=Phyllosticta citriasiana TaxID=595635 RepID=A0ABR1KD29_9PEZI
MDSLKDGTMQAEVEELLAGTETGDYVSKDRFSKAMNVIKRLQREILRKNYELAKAKIDYSFEQRNDPATPVDSVMERLHEQETDPVASTTSRSDTRHRQETSRASLPDARHDLEINAASMASRTDTRYSLRSRPSTHQKPEMATQPKEQEDRERHLPPIPASAFIVQEDELRERLRNAAGGNRIRHVRQQVDDLPHGRTAILMTGKCEAIDILHRPSGGSGLILQLAGLRQKTPCDRCCNAGSLGRPFVGCRAVPGFFGGACANCIYNDEKQHCNCSSFDPSEEPMTADEYIKSRAEDKEVDEVEEHISRLEAIKKAGNAKNAGTSTARASRSKPSWLPTAKNIDNTGDNDVEIEDEKSGGDNDDGVTRKRKRQGVTVKIPATKIHKR